MRLPKKVAALLTITLVASSGVGTLSNAQSKPATEQLVGAGRWETAIEISKKGWSSSKEAIIVNDSAIADALSATPFADAKNLPILLSGKDKLDDRTKVELKRLGVTKVYLVGGEAVLSKNIESELKGQNITTDRIFGANREKTSLEIANRLDGIKDVSEIAVVNGYQGLADAVSVAGAAAAKDMPIILASPNNGTAEADAFIKREDIKTSYVIGGEAVVSETVKNKLPNAKRVAGKNRSETNAKVLEAFYTDIELKNAYIAKDGKNKEDQLIDALAVGVLAAKNNSPIIIVGNKLDDLQKDVTNTKGFATLTQVGGRGNEAAFNELKTMQEVVVHEATNVDELNAAIDRAHANDIINVYPKVIKGITRGTINEDLVIKTNKKITINLFRKYTGTIIVSAPNVGIVNNGTVADIVVADGAGTIHNGSDGVIGNLEIQESAGGVEIVNKGTVGNIVNDAPDTTIDNTGGKIENPIQGSVIPPVIEGNTGGGSAGGGSTGGGSGPSVPQAQDIQLVSGNFNTHRGEDYRGISVGYELKGNDVGNVTSVKVELLDTEGNLMVTNTSKESSKVNEAKEYSSAFIVSEGTYTESSTWNFGEWEPIEDNVPVKAVVTVTDNNGLTYKLEQTTLSTDTSTWQGLFYEEDELVEIDSVEDLEYAINNQAEGQVWIIKNGTYNVGRFDNITQGNQTGWYFPITENGIKIKGESKDDVIITSDVESANGNWASQDYISVWSDGVTIENITIKPKIETNKTIEVMGKDFTLKNVNFVQRENATEEFAGSLYFNPQNIEKTIGNSSVENVLINDAWISCSSNNVTDGELLLKNVTLDWEGAEYSHVAGGYGVISNNLEVINVAEDGFFKVIVDNTHQSLQDNVINRIPNRGEVELLAGDYYLNQELHIPEYITVNKDNANFIITKDNEEYVTNESELINAVKNPVISNIIIATGEYKLDEQIRIDRALTLQGLGDVNLTVGDKTWENNTGEKGHASIITIIAGDKKVELNDIKVSGANNIEMTSGKDYGSGINVVNSTDVTLNNIISSDNEAAGLIVNKSNVTANNFNTENNTWYGVNVDNGEATFTLTGESQLSEEIQIVSDKGSVNVNAEGYTHFIGEDNRHYYTNKLPKGAYRTNGDIQYHYSTIEKAIQTAKDGDTIKIVEGTYDIQRGTEVIEGQSGWYLPITQDDLTIEGIGEVVLTSTEVSENGSWSSQNLVTIFGNNVTLKNLIITPKFNVSKSVEVVGNVNFTIEDCEFKPNELAEYLGGSLYFNGNGSNGENAILVKNNKFNYTTVAFDGVQGSKVEIVGNTFENIREGAYAIGNTYWGSEDRKQLQYTDINIRGNSFKNITDNTKIITARLNQTFILDGANTINGSAIEKNDFQKYINFDELNSWDVCQNRIVIVDGVEYVNNQN